MLNKLSMDEFELFIVQCWLTWNQRNTIVHGGKLQDLTQLNIRARDYLEEYKEAQNQLAIVAHTVPRQSRSPPLRFVYKLNFDATVFTQIGASGCGAMVRNEMGLVIAALLGKGPPVLDSKEAKVLACRKAMEFMVDSSFSEIILEGDNVNVIKVISSPTINLSRLVMIYKDIRCLVAGLRSFSASCVRRSANSVAYSLDRYACHIDDDVVWLEESPQLALEALYLDSIF